MAIETDITKLVFNKLSNEKYEELKANGELVNNEFYITPDSKEDFDGEVPTKVSELENDLGFITADDVDLSSKADKETTYTKEEVDNLIQNIDIPEQTPNIEGGEYIDVKSPKGETLYEYDDYIIDALNTETTKNMFLTTNLFVEEPFVMTQSNAERPSIQTLLSEYRLPEKFIPQLMPVLKEDKSQYCLYEILAISVYDILLGGIAEYTDEAKKECILAQTNNMIDPMTPVYCINYEGVPYASSNVKNGLMGVYQDANNEWVFTPLCIWELTPIKEVQVESSSNTLVIDFNEKALEMIENAGSDITTNGWNIFDHKFSDHLLNDPSWVRSDTYSWQDGGIYFTAYEELEKEFNDAKIGEKVSTGSWYVWLKEDGTDAWYTPISQGLEGSVNICTNPSGSGIIDKTTGETPISQMVSGTIDTTTEQYTLYGYILQDETYESWEMTDPIKEEYIYDSQGNKIGYFKYYVSPNGLKICPPSYPSNPTEVDISEQLNILYNEKGVAWYYIIDTENKRFKLPRSKWNFVGSRGNVGDYVDETLPNIKGNVKNVRWQDTTDEMEGAFSDSTKDSINLQNYYQGTKNSDAGLLDFNASNSSSTYQDNAPVQQRATEMYLYFFMGDTLRDARIIDVNAAIEKANIIEEKLDNTVNKSTFQVVSELPEDLVENTFYFIVE